MPLTTTQALVASARAGQFGVAAFNVITLEHAEAVVAGAAAAGSSVILQLSQNAVAFHHGQPGPIAAAMLALLEASPVPGSLHLDHVEDLDLLHRAAECGFSSVMFDAGARPYADNVAQTRAAVAWGHAHGLWIEAELGYIGGKPNSPRSAHAPGVRTDPAEAAAFVTATEVDALAVAVGSSHAMTTKSATLDFELIGRLARAVPVPLVLHGSSGIADGDLRRAVAVGIVKVNIGTALNVAMTGAVREVLAGDPALTDPRRYLSVARDAMSRVVRDAILLLSQATPAP